VIPGSGERGVSGCVAYLAPMFPSLHETFVYREVRELRRRGWTVHAVTLHPPAGLPDASFDDLLADLTVVYRDELLGSALAELVSHPIRFMATMTRAIGDALAPGESLSLRQRVTLIGQALAGITLARELRHRGVLRLHCHFAHSSATVGMYAASHLGAPFSFTGHANDLFQRRSLLKRKLERASFVACISHWHREFYRDIEPAGDDRYVLIRCGIDVDRWIPRRSAMPGDGPLQVLTVCRLVEKKGVDVLIRAIAQTKRAVVLTIAGDGPERAALRSLAETLGCADRILWLGALENERVRELMQHADVFALACRTDSQGDRDGIPVVLMEAMACGLAVISGDIPAIRELIDDGVDGLFVAENDHDALARQIDHLTRERRARMADPARRKIEGEFSMKVNVDRLERSFARIGT
jgi:colanic acid/amylovoran biosynthesis glycosyltransferase